MHTVAQVEERFYNPGPGANGPFHPVSWCRDYDGGRSFYTGMGHTDGSYGEDAFRKHLTGALKWTTGIVRGDCQATIAANYQIERLTAANKPGQLDQIGEPHGLTVAPDGTVFYVGKAACPTGPVVDWANPNVGLGCGTIHSYDPSTKQVKLLTTLRVMGNRGSGGELVKNEEGLLGIAPDPNFAENSWLYVYWMPHDSIDREKRIGQRTVSRFTYDRANQTIDQATRKDVLQWPAQIHSCCHAGGGMAFDNEGNLYIGSGDSNSSGGSSGYSGNNWTLDYQGVSFQDARRTAGNTNDLNGKIIRIHPEPDGTYTIPDGNLFPPGTEKTRPEIYVMGVRNISRLAIDPVHQWLTAGWVGPDAGEPEHGTGPGQVRDRHDHHVGGQPGLAVLHGQPAAVPGPQQHRRHGADRLVRLRQPQEHLAAQHRARRPAAGARQHDLVLAGRWRTGLPDAAGRQRRPDLRRRRRHVHPAVPARRRAGRSCPARRTTASSSTPAAASPGRPTGTTSGSSGTRPTRRTGSPSPSTRPACPGRLRRPSASRCGRSSPAATATTKLQSWMDAKFGTDGALYMLDYGGGFFTLHANQKLIRVTYQGGPATPVPAASAVAVQNKPLTVAFTGTRSGGVSYQWEFGDGTTSTEANPRHTYPRAGTYTAKLTVTYEDGETATTQTTVTVGCEMLRRPESRCGSATRTPGWPTARPAGAARSTT